MNIKTIKTNLKQILNQSEKNFGIKIQNNFKTNESLLTSGIIDSFGLFSFIEELQKKFHIKIENKEIHPGNFETIDNIATFIYNKILN